MTHPTKPTPKMPRWLELQAEIDYSIFLLGRIYADLKNKTPIDQMIDEATGFDQAQVKEANELMDKIDALKEEYYKITGE